LSAEQMQTLAAFHREGGDEQTSAEREAMHDRHREHGINP